MDDLTPLPLNYATEQKWVWRPSKPIDFAVFAFVVTAFALTFLPAEVGSGNPQPDPLRIGAAAVVWVCCVGYVWRRNTAAGPGRASIINNAPFCGWCTVALACVWVQTWWFKGSRGTQWAAAPQTKYAPTIAATISVALAVATRARPAEAGTR